MPLFDLFKKPSKKDPAKDNPLGQPELQKKRYDAAMEFLKFFQENTPLLGGKPHAGTVLSVPARLAGTSLYRSLNYKNHPAPGVVVLSDEVNEAYPRLLNVFAFYCKQNGIDVMSKPLVTEFPEQDKPRMEIAEVRAEYQDLYDEIMKKHGLGDLDAAYAGMILCSIVFQYHCVKAKDIDPFVATGIIARGVIEGAKTSPGPSGTKPKQPARKERRFVLGEHDAAVQDALDNGGGFIDINPGVLNMLKTKNIDPFLVYEQAVLKQMEEKVDRFDFVPAEVETWIREWSGKPADQAPIHVRLALWMKNNAASHGYVQSGNSWILKS
jgi:hypothetical protein